MSKTATKNCYCHTCRNWYHPSGVTQHRFMHKRKKQDCTITYTSGKTYDHKYTGGTN